MFLPQEKVTTELEPVTKILENLDTTVQETPSEPLQSRENMTKALSLWKASGITERHRDFKPEDSTSDVWTEQWNKLKNFIGNGVLAIILGQRGAGKSQMAVCAIRESCKHLKSAKYIKALNFFLAIRASYKDKTVTEDQVVQEFSAPFLLVIDAVENRGETSFENILLNHLIDMRYDRCKDTILISNQNEKDFAASMGPSIVDRIHECGIKIICNQKSFRRKI